VFPGLDRLAIARLLVPEAADRDALFEATEAELVAEDAWMYIAPWKVPSAARGRWKPVVTPKGKDCVVVGESHLRESPSLTLYLDIFHELCHVLQRKAGRELWDMKYTYVTRPTEVEAYRFVVDEARRLRVADEVIREYLKVEWIDDGEFRQLLDALGVPAT